MDRLMPAGPGRIGSGQKTIVLLLCLSLLFLLASCGAAPAVTAPEDGAGAEGVQPSPESKPQPAPTENPVSLPAPTEDPAPPIFAPPIPGAGVAPDGTFDETALFIGDSLTAALIMFLRRAELLGSARYMAICSYSMPSFYGGPLLDSDAAELYGMECSGEFYGLSYAQAVRQAGDSVGAVYYMLGTNGSSDVTPESYTAILSYIRDCCPHAAIYAQTIPYSVDELSDYHTVNSAILESVTGMRTAGDEDVYVLDTFTAIGTEHMSGDGLHLTDEGLALWYALIAGDRAGRS